MLSIERYKTHYRSLVSLGIPIVVGQIGTVLFGVVDTLMIGRHSTLELAAAGFVNTVFAILLIFAIGFSNAITPIVGHMYGRGDIEHIGGIVKNSLAANTLLAAILVGASALLYAFLGSLGQPDELLPLMRPYLLILIATMPLACWFNVFKQFFDAVGDTRSPMKVILAVTVVNIIGNYILIYGVRVGGHTLIPEMGLLGAGIATLVSRAVSVALMAAIFFISKKNKVYSRGLLGSNLNKHDFGRINRMGWPLAFQLGMESAAFMLTAVMVGWIGSAHLAAHQVMMTLSQVFYMVYCGLTAAVAVRVSHFYGQRDKHAAEMTPWAAFHIILVVAVAIAIPAYLLREHIGFWFTDSPEVASLVASCVPMLILYQFGDGLQCTFCNALRGLACVKAMIIVSFISYFIVSLPLSYIFAFSLGWGLTGIWGSFPVCLTVAGILYYISFNHYKKRVFE